MGVKIQFRRDTATNWTSNNPILSDGELGLETDTRLFKVGNGTTAWNTLPYITKEFFTDLQDTPADYTGKSLQFLRVSEAEDGIEFAESSAVVAWEDIIGTQSSINLSGFTNDSGFVTTDEKVKYDSEDPTAGYVEDKVIAGTGIAVAEGNGGNVNKLVVSNNDTGSSAVTTHEGSFVHEDIAHSNRVALDAVTGVNTGDQDLTPYAIDEDVKKYAGFENRTDSTMTMTGSTFSITGDYNIWINGTGKVNITTAKTVEITADQELSYIYFDWFDGDIRLNVSTTAWDFRNGDVIPTALVFKDGTTYALSDERHGYNRDVEWHNWAHLNIGAMYFDGLAGTFTDTTLSITQGTIFDEDIDFNTGGTKTTTSLWYRNATDGMRIIRGSTTPYSYDGDIKWDNGSGTLQEVGNNNYYVSWVYATNDPAEPIYTVIGQGSHANLNAARGEAQPIINLTTAEWKLLYKVIYRNTTTPSYIEASDFRSVQTGVAVQSVSPTSHSILTDRDATGSHPATAISNTPAGGIEAIEVQAAINELDTEKLSDITGESIGDLSDVDDTGKANLKILKYNSTSTNWEAADDNDTTYTAGDNIDITSEEISLVDKPTIDATSPTAKGYTPATGAQTVTIDCALNNQHAVTGHADGTAITFAISNATNNQPFIISITQGAVVSTITAWFATVKWAGGVAPTLTATVDKRDVFGFIRTGANTYDGFIIGQNI